MDGIKVYVLLALTVFAAPALHKLLSGLSDLLTRPMLLQLQVRHGIQPVVSVSRLTVTCFAFGLVRLHLCYVFCRLFGGAV